MSDSLIFALGVALGAILTFASLFFGYTFGFKARNVMGNAMGELWVAAPVDEKLPEPFGFNPFDEKEPEDKE